MENGNVKSKMNKKTLLIVLLNVFFILVGLGGAATGTIAWFSANNSVEATASTFQVVAPEGLSFELYYLDHFVANAANKDGNQNVTTKLFSGYQLEYATPVFSKIEYDGNGHSIPLYYSTAGNLVTLKDNAEACTSVNDGYLYTDGLSSQQTLKVKNAQGTFDDGFVRSPASIEQLWPARKMTYAIVTTDTLASFALNSGWSDVTSESIIDQDNRQIHLSWAINMYGAAYSVPITAPTQQLTEEQAVLQDIASAYYHLDNGDPAGYHTYMTGNSKTDCFAFGPSTVDYGTACPIVNNIAQTPGEQTILFFTIEFSNSDDTFYKYTEVKNEQGVVTRRYYNKDTTGNSNCYERLRLSGLQFKLS